MPLTARQTLACFVEGHRDRGRALQLTCICWAMAFIRRLHGGHRIRICSSWLHRTSRVAFSSAWPPWSQVSGGSPGIGAEAKHREGSKGLYSLWSVSWIRMRSFRTGEICLRRYVSRRSLLAFLSQVVLSTCVDLFQILRELGLRSRTRIRLYSQIWFRNSPMGSQRSL